MKKNFFLFGKIKILLLCSLLSSTLLAQSVEEKFDELTVTIANCVLQDINGFMWIGSQEGLLRYDGYELKKYHNIPFDSTSLSANWVTALAEDKFGNLWVGTINGLNYFDQLTEQFTHFILQSKVYSKISSKSISKIVIDEEGSLWLGSTDLGLFYAKVNNNRDLDFAHYNFKDIFDLNDPDEKVWIRDICDDKTGFIWVGTDYGLIKINRLTAETICYKNDPDDPTSLSYNTVRSIQRDSLGNIWIGTGSEYTTTGGGLNIFNLHSGQFINFQNISKDIPGIFSNRIFPILIDSEGILWMGSPNLGIVSIPISELIDNQNPNFSLAVRHKLYGVQSMYEDRLRNIWFARFFGRKLYKYDRQQNPFFWYHRVEDNLNTMSSSGVVTIFIDRSQNIWFGHNSPGLDKYNPETGVYKNYLPRPNNPDYLNSGNVCGIQEDSNGYIWIATMNNGIYKMDPAKETFQKFNFNYQEFSGKQIDIIRLILMSKSGNLYIGTFQKGLFLFNPQSRSLKSIDIGGGEENVATSSLFEDKEGTLWFGTLDDGLYEIKFIQDEVEKVQHFAHKPSDPNSLSYNQICDVIRPTLSDTNAIWIATGNGLNRLDLQTKSFTHFYEKDGIPNNNVLKILEDNQGNIWIACAYGIGKYDIKNGNWKSYGVGDGMPFETFGGCRQNTDKSEDGQLFFSGGSGTIGFYPEQIKDNPLIPQIRFTDFKIFHESVKLDTSILFKKVITLSYVQNAFSFEFAALNYTNPGKNQYAYKMEGFNDEWIYSGNEHTATFTNLDPGRYIFRVKGSNNHGIWNEEGTSISIIISPPWWATWWFRAIVIIALIAIGYRIYRYRVNKILEMERLRVQIASDLHDDIGSALTRIAVHSEIIQTTTEKEKVSSASKRIGNMSREIITTLSDVVWSIDSRNDTVGDLIDRMRDFLDTVFPAGSIHIDFQTKGLHFDQKVEQTLRQNIYLIFKEAANNAAKHSGADKIKISMINGDGKFKLEISDNGFGMNESKMLKGHHGIENMKLRAKRINGELKIENLEKGTSVTLIAKNI
jgi:ligand-binding sensor domain-containing protein/two-component sensor histidine kinase